MYHDEAIKRNRDVFGPKKIRKVQLRMIFDEKNGPESNYEGLTKFARLGAFDRTNLLGQKSFSGVKSILDRKH